MLHQGQKIRDLSYKKGYKQVDLAKLRGVTSQTISHEFRQEKIGLDSLKWYASTLKIDLSELTNEKTNENQVNNIYEKYVKALEKIDFLQNVIMKNGIRVEIPNFNYVSSLPRVTGLFFLSLLTWLLTIG